MILTLRNGTSDISKWFLFNNEKLKYGLDLQEHGLIMDFGAFKGEFTKRTKLKNPNMTFWLYEPISKYSNIAANRFSDSKNVKVNNYGVSADGRDIEMKIDNLRSRHNSDSLANNVLVKTMSIQEIFNSVTEIELIKMNIEGMEYECLEQLVKSSSLIKARHLLIQFHNFDPAAKYKLETLRNEFEKDFRNVFSCEWMWELWIRKEK